MASFKLVLAVILAIGATQVAAKPQPKYLDTVIVDVMKIADLLISRIQEGLTEADPIIDEIQSELSDALAGQVGLLRDDLRTLLANVINRVQVLEKEVTEGLDQIQSTIGPCIDAAEAPIDAELAKAEDAISDIIDTVKADNEEGLTDLGDGIDSITLRLDEAVDKAIAGALVCVKPGAAGVKACLDAINAALISTVKGLLAEGALLLTEAIDVVGTVAGQAINATIPVINNTVDAIAPTLETFGTCVTNTKPITLY